MGRACFPMVLYAVLSILASTFLASHAFLIDIIPGIRIVPFQHVGVYIRHGSLLPHVLAPGMAFYWPILTHPHDVFTGIDHDIVPPSSAPLLECRTLDGGIFAMRFDVSNRLNATHVLQTLNVFGLQYDRSTIYDQVTVAVKDVCSKMSSHDIAIEQYDRIDDLIADKLRERQQTLGSKVEIVQIKIQTMNIPAELNQWFARQASERARRRALIEERESTREETENNRLLHIAALYKNETLQHNDALLQVIKARAEFNVSRIKADAQLYAKKQEAEGDAVWLTSQRLRLEEIRVDPMTVIIHRIKVALWGS
jgi:regulator of protease activity HflC (stomatin/prohibitin superfamily)